MGNQLYRVLILPATVSDGVISFNTITIEMCYDGNTIKLASIQKSDPVNIYIDPLKEPKFSRCADGKGWCSPTEEKQEQLVSAGLDIDECTIIRCKCQREELTHEDIKSLEQCGHAKECPKATRAAPAQRPQTIAVVPVEDRVIPPGTDPEIVAKVEADNTKPKEFTPPNGVPRYAVIPNLVSYLQGTTGNEMTVAMGLEAIGWTNPYDEMVVIKELATFENFTICQSCGLWSVVADKSRPKCLSCIGNSMGNMVSDES